MKPNIFLNLILIGYILIIIAFWMGRYSIYTTKEYAYKLDRWSGNVSFYFLYIEKETKKGGLDI
jgi:hypothetical protein